MQVVSHGGSLELLYFSGQPKAFMMAFAGATSYGLDTVTAAAFSQLLMQFVGFGAPILICKPN